MGEEALLLGSRGQPSGGLDGSGVLLLVVFAVVLGGIAWSRLEPKRLLALVVLGGLAYLGAPLLLG